MMPTQNIGSVATIPITRDMPASHSARQSPVETAKLAAPVTSVNQAVAPPDVNQVKQATALINKTILSLSRDIEFTVDESSKENVVRVVDTSTGDVIRQMPSEEALQIAKALDHLQGLLIKQKA